MYVPEVMVRKPRLEAPWRRLAGCLGALLALLALEYPAAAADLMAVYADALHSDPQLSAAEDERLASHESRPQALAALLPQLSGTGSQTREQSSGTAAEFAINPRNGAPLVLPYATTSASTGRHWGVALEQTLFSWANWQALKSAGKQVAQAEADYQASEQGLVMRVAQAYFSVLSAHDTLEADEAALRAFARQLEQAKERLRVGLIVITDAEEAEADRDSAAAAVIAAKRALATAEDRLEEITEKKYDVLSRPGPDMPLLSPVPANEERWVEVSLDQNPALLSSRLAADVARDNVAIAIGGHLPTIEFVASKSYATATYNEKFAGIPFDNVPSVTRDRQYSIQVTVPIFSGGLTQSRVRQSQYLWLAARDRVAQSSRATERQARDAYLGVISGVSRVAALRKAVQSSETALRATEAGYEVGTRTAIDVLDSRRRLVQAQTDYAGSRYDYLISVIQLRFASGNLGRAQLAEINDWLVESVQTTPREQTPESPAPAVPPDAAH